MMPRFSFYIIHLLISWCHALKIFEDSLSAPTYKLFHHRTAEFGPMIGTYNVSGPLSVAFQDTYTAHLSGCDISEYETNTSDGEIIYEQIYNASIAMVLRGNCTFSEKVYNAQLLGAMGVIVGDENGTNNEWIVMSRHHDGNTITIPSVFVRHNTFQWILRLFHSKVQLDEEVYVVMDSMGEYVATTSTIWLAAFGIVIIVIPTLWCFIVCMALLRKRIITYVQSSRRRQRLTSIPVISYKGNGCGINIAADKSISLSIDHHDHHHIGGTASITSNSSKSAKSAGVAKDDLNANLMDDDCECDPNCNDHDGDMNLLQSTMVGTLGQNLKAVSVYLFKPFQHKKAPSTPHNESCAICLDDFKVDEELRLLPCKHAFHKSCVDPWLAKSSELCPMCKQSIFMNQEKEDRSVTLGKLCYWCCISNNGRHRGNDHGPHGDDEDANEPRIVVLADPELVSIDTDSHSEPESQDESVRE